MAIRYAGKQAKTILRIYRTIDPWFWCRYGINVYQGCEFACTYCDSRSHRYHLHSNFDQLIYLKENAAELLDDRLSRARSLLPDVVALSGAGDPYQPAEERFGMTRKCLEVLADHKFPVHVMTKSDLVLRDLDILKRIADDSWCSVSFTVTTMNEDIASFLEPRAPAPQLRMEALRKVKEAGIQTGVNMMPLVPFLCDSLESIERVVMAAEDSGADHILFSGMTMRDDQAQWYLRRLGERYPDLVGPTLELYGSDTDHLDGFSGNYNPSGVYYADINKKVLGICERSLVPVRMNRFIPGDFRRENYLLSQQLFNEAFREQTRGNIWRPLHYAAMSIQSLKEPVRAIAGRGELGGVGNIDGELERRILTLFKEPVQSRL